MERVAVFQYSTPGISEDLVKEMLRDSLGDFMGKEGLSPGDYTIVREDITLGVTPVYEMLRFFKHRVFRKPREIIAYANRAIYTVGLCPVSGYGVE